MISSHVRYYCHLQHCLLVSHICSIPCYLSSFLPFFLSFSLSFFLSYFLSFLLSVLVLNSQTFLTLLADCLAYDLFVHYFLSYLLSVSHSYLLHSVPWYPPPITPPYYNPVPSSNILLSHIKASPIFFSSTFPTPFPLNFSPYF